MKTYKVNGTEVIIEVSRYSNNNSLAICVSTVKGEPYAVLSVNIDESDYIEPNQCFIDTNNCSWAETFLKENNIGKKTDKIGESGFCEYPLYDFSEFIRDYFKGLYDEIRMPGNPRFCRIYQVGFRTYNIEITRADTHINLTATKEQMDELQDWLNGYNYIDDTEEYNYEE